VLAPFLAKQVGVASLGMGRSKKVARAASLASKEKKEYFIYYLLYR
jgi:hypothetical protein